MPRGDLIATALLLIPFFCLSFCFCFYFETFCILLLPLIIVNTVVILEAWKFELGREVKELLSFEKGAIVRNEYNVELRSPWSRDVISCKSMGGGNAIEMSVDFHTFQLNA